MAATATSAEFTVRGYQRRRPDRDRPGRARANGRAQTTHQTKKRGHQGLHRGQQLASESRRKWMGYPTPRLGLRPPLRQGYALPRVKRGACTVPLYGTWRYDVMSTGEQATLGLPRTRESRRCIVCLIPIPHHQESGKRDEGLQCPPSDLGLLPNYRRRTGRGHQEHWRSN